MNEQLKKRLVGAVVLVSLAVIFVPMVLDGSGRVEPESSAAVIPERPEFHFEPLAIEEQAPLPLEPAALVVEAPEAESEPVPAPPAKPEPAARPQAAAPKAPAPPPVAAAPAGFVVQVGSFNRSSNALGLRDRLRKNGFTAFVEKVEGKGGAVYRVRVGPEMDKARADALRGGIEKQLGIAGLVMNYP